MEREAKAKVVASVWGAEFIPFLAALATYLAYVDLEEKVESILFFQNTTCKIDPFEKCNKCDFVIFPNKI